MNIAELERLITEETVRRCGHEERKGKLSMSWLHLPDQEILNRYRNGCAMSVEQKRKLYQGTHAEDGMFERLLPYWTEVMGIPVFTTGSVVPALAERVRNVLVSAYDGRLTGHIDFVISKDEFIEYKTIAAKAGFEAQRQQNRVSFKTSCQCQSYLLWGRFEKCLVVTECLESGDLWIVEIRPHESHQTLLREKVERLLGKI